MKLIQENFKCKMRLSLSTPVSFTPYNYLTVTDMLVIYEGTIFQCNRKLKGSIPPSVSFYSDIYICVFSAIAMMTVFNEIVR